MSLTPTFAMVAKATAAGILTNMISVILLDKCHAKRYQSGGKIHLHTFWTDIACDTSDVSGVRYESHVACVCVEPHSNSLLCFSSFCSSVCTFCRRIGSPMSMAHGTRKLTVLLPWMSREIFGRGIGVSFLAGQICGAGTQSGNISAHSALWLATFQRTNWKSRQRAFRQFCWRRGHRRDCIKWISRPQPHQKTSCPYVSQNYLCNTITCVQEPVSNLDWRQTGYAQDSLCSAKEE